MDNYAIIAVQTAIFTFDPARYYAILQDRVNGRTRIKRLLIRNIIRYLNPNNFVIVSKYIVQIPKWCLNLYVSYRTKCIKSKDTDYRLKYICYKYPKHNSFINKFRSAYVKIPMLKLV